MENTTHRPNCREQRFVRLAKLLCTSVDWPMAEKIDEIYPGFLGAYEKAQDQWEREQTCGCGNQFCAECSED